jgi:hypothetical protein
MREALDCAPMAIPLAWGASPYNEVQFFAVFEWCACVKQQTQKQDAARNRQGF